MEIKFRVYDEADKKYLDEDRIFICGNGNIFYDSVIGDLYPVENATVLQYTGFNNIYEGDVVYDQANEAYALIKWDKDDGVWMFEYDDERIPLGDCYYNEFNVVAHYPATPEQAYQDYLEKYGVE